MARLAAALPARVGDGPCGSRCRGSAMSPARMLSIGRAVLPPLTWNRILRHGSPHSTASPFAALRVIADPAERMIPSAALVGMRPRWLDRRRGRPPAPSAASPGICPASFARPFDARAAFSALQHSRQRLNTLFQFNEHRPETQRDERALPPFGLDIDVGFPALEAVVEWPAESS